MALSTSSRAASPLPHPSPFLSALPALWRVCLSFTMMYNYTNTSVVQGNFNESVEKTVQTYRSLDSLDTFRSLSIIIIIIIFYLGLLFVCVWLASGWNSHLTLNARQGFGLWRIFRRCCGWTSDEEELL